jgi:hypothetical protein
MNNWRLLEKDSAPSMAGYDGAIRNTGTAIDRRHVTALADWNYGRYAVS